MAAAGMAAGWGARSTQGCGSASAARRSAGQRPRRRRAAPLAPSAPLVVSLEALPRQAAVEQEEQRVGQALQVVAPAGRAPQVRVHAAGGGGRGSRGGGRRGGGVSGSTGRQTGTAINVFIPAAGGRRSRARAPVPAAAQPCAPACLCRPDQGAPGVADGAPEVVGPLVVLDVCAAAVPPLLRLRHGRARFQVRGWWAGGLRRGLRQPLATCSKPTAAGDARQVSPPTRPKSTRVQLSGALSPPDTAAQPPPSTQPLQPTRPKSTRYSLVARAVPGWPSRKFSGLTSPCT